MSSLDPLMQAVDLPRVERALESALLDVTQRRLDMIKTANTFLEKDFNSLRGKAALNIADDMRKQQTKLCKQLVAIRKVMKE